LRPRPTAGSLSCMATDAATPPASDLAALYRAAVETGDAAELVRALCLFHGVSLRGLAELSGVTQRALSAWSRGERTASQLALRLMKPMVHPNRTLSKRVEQVRKRWPFGLRGRPKSRRSS